MKKHLLILFAAFATLAASAHDFKVNGIYYNKTSSTTAEVTYKGDDSGDYNEYSGSITIPATVTYNGVAYSVTSIGNSAFAGCSLTTITLPEGVTSIGERAFSGCSLTAITIPESVTSIGEYAFWSCDGLTSITIPESVTSIGIAAFAHCCSNLTAIVVAEGNKVYDSRGGCNAIIETSSNTLIQGSSATIIPASVTSIGSSAFRGCSSLTAITIPESVTSIGEYAFSECNSLKSITLPEGVTWIGGSAFWACRSLTSITIPASVTSIGEHAFSGCSSLKSITIPEGVTSIGGYTIYGCSSLTAITIPKGVKSIGVHAFTHCSSLTSITCEASTPPTLVVDPGSFYGVDKSIPVYVPAGSVEAYKVAEGWSEFTNIRPLGKPVTEIILNQTSATLTEGETLVLTATVTPDDATDKSISWSSSNPSVATVDNTGKVTAVAPGTAPATITATANDGSRVSASCVVEVLGKCATPTISYVDGEVVFTCETEEVTFISETTENIAGNRNDAKFAVIPTYTITAYATKEKYEDSDEVTLTLCWVPCEEDHEEDNGVLNIPAKPVLISTQGGTITVSGLAAGTAVAAYSTAGTELATATATDGTATLATNLTAGSIAIVKIGDYSIKVAIK